MDGTIKSRLNDTIYIKRFYAKKDNNRNLSYAWPYTDERSINNYKLPDTYIEDSLIIKSQDLETTYVKDTDYKVANNVIIPITLDLDTYYNIYFEYEKIDRRRALVIKRLSIDNNQTTLRKSGSYKILMDNDEINENDLISGTKLAFDKQRIGDIIYNQGPYGIDSIWLLV